MGAGLAKPAISPKRLKIDGKLQLTAHIKSRTLCPLVQKRMTLSDLHLIDSRLFMSAIFVAIFVIYYDSIYSGQRCYKN